jgi:hypothetical protein
MKKLLFLLAIAFLTVGSSAQQQVTKNFSDVSSVVVEGFFLDVTVDATSGNNVEFSGNITSREPIEGLKIQYKQTGSELKIWIDQPKKRGSYSANGILDLRVPAKTNIRVNNVSGNIMASDLGGEDISLESISGKIRCTNILSNLYIESVSGSVYVERVKGNLVAKSISGRLEISDVGGSLNSSSVSGSVVVNNVNGSTRVSSTSGRLEITEINSRLHANTTSGRISIGRVDGDVECSSISGGVNLSSVTGALNIKTTSGGINGDNITINSRSSFTTMSGNVNMLLTNANQLSYDLESFSGRLKARGHDAKKNLYIEKDNVWVKGKSFSGSQTYM